MTENGPVTYSIDALLKQEWSKASIRKAMKEFRCERNQDVEEFAHRRAVGNETNGSTRTYLTLDDELFDRDMLRVAGFVSVALTSTDYSGVSLEERRSILGNVPGIWVASSFPGYLIAELARDDRYGSDQVNGELLINFAEARIRDAMTLVAGGLVYLDCKDEMVGYYNGFGYEEIYLDERTGLHKMMKRLEA